MREAARCAGWILAAHALCGLLLLAPAYIRPDSVATYSYLRSMTFDGDLSFFNEWQMFGLVQKGVTLFSEVTPVGALANHWWIGTSMMTAPFYIVLRPFAQGDGFAGAYGSLLAWASVLFVAAALSIAFAIAHTSRSARATALIAISLGTPLFWYTFRFPLGTHAAGTLCVALILAALFLPQLESHAGMAAGLAAGLAIATRLQHFVLVPAVIVIAIRQRRDIRWWTEAFLAGMIPIAAQAIAWTSIYGTPFGPVTRGANLQGVTWMPFRHIALAEVLFSSYHGLLIWSPVVVLAFIGWAVAWRSARDLSLACMLMFAGEWLANGTLDRYFWGGMSFGGRRFVDLAVPFVLGMAWFAERFGPRITMALAAPMVAWSVALMVAAHANAISLARYVSGDVLIGAVFSLETWRRAAATPLHVATEWSAVLVIIAVGALLIALRRFAWPMAIAYSAAFVVAVTICAVRTQEHVAGSISAIGIDVRKSSRIGPLLDERRLLGDEVDWARARGDGTRADATTNELRGIDHLLSELSR